MRCSGGGAPSWGNSEAMGNRINFDERVEQMRGTHSANLFTDLPSGAFSERHYSVAQIAAMWNLSPDAVRKLFQKEPGVLVLDNTEGRHRRRYATLRVPESVVVRVHRRMTRV